MSLKVTRKDVAEKRFDSKSRVSHYYKWNGKPMARIEGNFYKGNFPMSRTKIKAILENSDELQKFVNGEYDQELDNLKEEQVLVLEEGE